MTIQQLCDICETLRTSLYQAGKQMDGKALSVYRKKLAGKYHAEFLNGWTVQLHRPVSDVFHAASHHVLTQSKKGLFGSTTTHYTTRMTLTAPQMPECGIACTVRTKAPLPLPEEGADVRISGELQVIVFLGGEQPQWKTGEFLKHPRVLPL